MANIDTKYEVWKNKLLDLAMSEAADILIKTGRIEELEGKLRIKI